MTQSDKLGIIYESLLNGQRQQMVEQIDRWFNQYDFWDLFASYVEETHENHQSAWSTFTDAVISYHRIKSR